MNIKASKEPVLIPLLIDLQQNIFTSLDLINISSGGVVAEGVPSNTEPGYQIDFAYEIKKAIQIPILAGGMLREPNMLNSIINDGKADLVWLGRELLRNPYWVVNNAKKYEDIDFMNSSYTRAY